MTDWMYFNRDEFKCPHCNRNKIDNEFVTVLDEARTIAVVPFKITSGYRCPIHNKAVGGSPTSSHLKGWAVDIACMSDYQRMKIVRALIELDMHRIGVGKDFIHVDIDPGKNPVRLWVY